MEELRVHSPHLLNSTSPNSNKLVLNMKMQTSLLIFSILLFCLSCFTTAPISHLVSAKIIPRNETDFETLLAIKAQISADPHSVLSSWNQSNSLCNWHGITCGQKHRRVVSLNLSSSNIEGTLSPFIGNLSFLRHLRLQNNYFRGNIPHQVSQLPRLRALILGNNSFDGEIPVNISSCFNLQILSLEGNKLVGKIPDRLASLPNLAIMLLEENNLTGDLHAPGFGNMSASLLYVFLDNNNFHGSIPSDIGTSSNSLLMLSIADNMLSGTIPTSLFNHSSLGNLELSGNKLEGNLPQDIGLRLPQLYFLSLRYNNFTGKLPTSLSNLSLIQTLQLGPNSFTGGVELNGNNLPNLFFLNLAFAFDWGEVRDLSFVDTLTNCTNLHTIELEGNRFVGTFPTSILNFSTTLTNLHVSYNQISGHLPSGLGRFKNLRNLAITSNQLIGSIPVDVGRLESIERLDFSNNNFSGEIPSALGNLTRLSILYMEHNNFQGALPKSLGICKNLQVLDLSSNNLSAVFPVEVFDVSSLIRLNISQNNFQGSLPIEISKLKFLIELDVSHNRFSGEIPTTLRDCVSLTLLNMSENSFVGSIPESLSSMKSMQSLDLSCNHLSGQVPTYFSTWPYLLYLNLSFNALEGEVPINGVFANSSAVSIVGNSMLCGGVLELHLPRCQASKKKRWPLPLILIISILSALIITSVVAMYLYFLCLPRKRKDVSSRPENVKQLPEVSYQMLWRATDGFSPSNLLGVGAFGSVYKGTLVQDDTKVLAAVKVMNFHNRGATKSFMAECNALRNIRHRNIVKVITVCSSIDDQRNDFKALVYEFMPRGNLDSWLHSNLVVTSETVDDDQSYSLTLLQRLDIAIDVSCAIQYLHTGCVTPIIHCDLKPTNILLDDDMTACVGDFGLAKFLVGASPSSDAGQSSSTQVRGTVGYAAPEYGLGSKASVEGDIYSFGIIVLEMMTSKKPIDPMFSEGLNLHQFAKSAFPDRIMEIIDHKILVDDADIRKIECIKSLFMVGLQCSAELPQDRMRINDVVNELKSTR